jgi:hypothetical protein
MSLSASIGAAMANAAEGAMIGRAIGQAHARAEVAEARAASLFRQLQASRQSTAALERYARALENRVRELGGSA